MNHVALSLNMYLKCITISKRTICAYLITLQILFSYKRILGVRKNSRFFSCLAQYSSTNGKHFRTGDNLYFAATAMCMHIEGCLHYFHKLQTFQMCVSAFTRARNSRELPGK